MFNSIAALRLTDIVQPHHAGVTVNFHVVKESREPKIDYDAMNRLVLGGIVPSTSGHERIESESDPESR